MLRTMKNLIGEYSNYATAYRNRCGKTPEQQQKYANYIDIISVLVGKSIKSVARGGDAMWTKSVNLYMRGVLLPMAVKLTGNP